MENMKTLHLQGIGKMPAINAEKLKPGMVTVWNFGYKEKIKNIVPTKSGKSVKCTIVSMESGKEFIRTLRINRLVAIEQEE